MEISINNDLSVSKKRKLSSSGSYACLVNSCWTHTVNVTAADDLRTQEPGPQQPWHWPICPRIPPTLHRDIFYLIKQQYNNNTLCQTPLKMTQQDFVPPFRATYQTYTINVTATDDLGSLEPGPQWACRAPPGKPPISTKEHFLQT